MLSIFTVNMFVPLIKLTFFKASFTLTKTSSWFAIEFNFSLKAAKLLIEYCLLLKEGYEEGISFRMFAEFENKVKQVVFVSATPAQYELDHSKIIAEQIIRPTGLLDPEIIVRPININ